MILIQKILVPFFVFALLPSMLFAQAQVLPERPQTRTLKVLSYNVHGLPSPLGKDNGRMEEIGKRLRALIIQNQAPDVVLIQEGFRSSVEKLIKESGYPYVEKGPVGKDFGQQKNLDSGLYILSLHPIQAVHKIPFLSDSCTGWDCYASKGVLHVRIKVPGVPTPVDIMTTHMNSNKSSGSSQDKVDACKEKQINEAAEFTRQVTTTQFPVVFAGDFNLNPSRKHFDLLNPKLQMQNAGELCATGAAKNCQVPKETDPDTLWKTKPDQHLFRSGNGMQIRPRLAVKTFTEPFNDKPLSDHLGFEISYDLEW